MREILGINLGVWEKKNWNGRRTFQFFFSCGIDLTGFWGKTQKIQLKIEMTEAKAKGNLDFCIFWVLPQNPVKSIPHLVRADLHIGTTVYETHFSSAILIHRGKLCIVPNVAHVNRKNQNGATHACRTTCLCATSRVASSAWNMDFQIFLKWLN